MKRFKTVEAWYDSLDQWQPELGRLRKVLQSTKLQETVKWGMPCYTHHGKNVVGIGAFKKWFALWFYQGALLKDEAGVLVNAQEGVTKAMRQWRMTRRSDIRVRLIRSYVSEAIELVDEGKEIKPARNPKTAVVSPLLRAALNENRVAKKAYSKLSAACQREYANYINEAKKDDTKLRRIKKIIPMIEKGDGLNDHYRR